MQEYSQKTKEVSLAKRLVFSNLLAEKSFNDKIAYIAVMTAFVVIANMFFEFKLAQTQFSLTIVVSALCGIIIGPLFGFTACFLGDLVGYLYHSAGFAYMPWIGIAMGMVALVAGFVVNGIRINAKWGIYLKIAIVCVLTFLISTVGINTTAFWLLYAKGVPYFTYLTSRLIVQGQIWNSLANYVLLFIVIPVISRIKMLKIIVE